MELEHTNNKKNEILCSSIKINIFYMLINNVFFLTFLVLFIFLVVVLFQSKLKNKNISNKTHRRKSEI